jgi:cytochrome c peroxidase
VRADYLALRRAIASGAPYWQKLASTFVEPLLGPRRSTDEAGGALLLLDGALARNDDVAAAQHLQQIELALRVLEDGLAGRSLSTAAAIELLSDAAYDLGLLALEAAPGLPDGHDAVLADVSGALEAIERGVGALAASATASDAARELEATRAALAGLRRRLDGAVTSLDVRDRAAFARDTGELGAAVRRLGRALGAAPRLPYAPRIAAGAGGDDERVSALTLPAPRRALGGDGVPDPALARLGERLFRERRLSKGDARSCATCHDPTRAFADALARPRSLEHGGAALRHTPSLLYAPLAAVQMWDGRTLTPEQQARNVMHSSAEMGVSDAQLVEKLSAVESYRRDFSALSLSIDMPAVAKALVAYEVAAMVPGRSPIDRFARGDDLALSTDDRAGFDVFVGKGRCARCHVPPSFGGSRPRDFAVPIFAAIGVPEAPDRPALDRDRGRAAITGRPLDEHAFKTPTVRNAARTAPYFHNGAFPTLEQVVDFYDKGGARGLGLPLENQDPEVRPLRLRPEERRLLLHFLRTTLLDAR